MKLEEQEIEMQKEYIKKVALSNAGKKEKYAILTMGCQLNENDSEKLCGMLEEMGYERAEKFEDAKIAILNTCCVRENAEEKLFGKVGELKKLKKENYMMYDARKAYTRKIKTIISICRHNIWNTYTSQITRRYFQSIRKQEKNKRCNRYRWNRV